MKLSDEQLLEAIEKCIEVHSGDPESEHGNVDDIVLSVLSETHPLSVDLIREISGRWWWA